MGIAPIGPTALDRPPGSPPESQAPPMDTLAPQNPSGATASDIQMSGMALQLGMMIFKLLDKLAEVVPSVEPIIPEITQRLRSAITQGAEQTSMQGSNQLSAGPPLGGGPQF